MDVRQTVTQLYREYESGDVAKILDGLPDNFRFEWESDRDTPPSYRARVAHFWSFEDGIPVSLVEDMDTALIAGQIR